MSWVMGAHRNLSSGIQNNLYQKVDYISVGRRHKRQFCKCFRRFMIIQCCWMRGRKARETFEVLCERTMWRHINSRGDGTCLFSLCGRPCLWSWFKGFPTFRHLFFVVREPTVASRWLCVHFHTFDFSKYDSRSLILNLKFLLRLNLIVFCASAKSYTHSEAIAGLDSTFQTNQQSMVWSIGACVMSKRLIYVM